MGKIVPFATSLKYVLNGVDTYTFKHVVTDAESATRFKETSTISVKLAGRTAFHGVVKTCEDEHSGKLKTIVAESPISILRDQDIQEIDARGLSSIKNLIDSILPPGISIEYKSDKNPLLRYAFRSGSLITHLNTLCALGSLNWRQKLVSATEATIVISERGEEPTDKLVFVENKDIFNLKIDNSLFKKYTSVTAIGVEQEVSGYTCTASLTTGTYFYLDCDDGELEDMEILPENHAYTHLTSMGHYKRVSLSYGAELKGWCCGVNSVFKINDECMKFCCKSGRELLGVTRGHWGTYAGDVHVKGDYCLLVENLAIVASEGGGLSVSPATNLFKIGTEIVKGDLIGNKIKLATFEENSGIYTGRGLEYSDGSTFESPKVGWVHKNYNAYPHKQGAVVVPYYPDLQEINDPVLAVTIHGKGIVTKDGIDKLAWGTLLNIQNGILSGSCTYKSADFYDKNISVGQKIEIVTATSKDGNNIIRPSTTYPVIIYSITQSQNKLLHIEFGNVIPEVLYMLKSGEYALQAAVRKNTPFTHDETRIQSISGKIASWKNSYVRLSW